MRFDYVIVGAGSAGCVLANRLSASGRHSVAVLEAGGKDSSPWIHIPVGFPKNVVIDVAHEERVDLIVLGTSSADVLKRIIGSTTTGVLQNAPCDVLSVQSAIRASD